MIANKFHETLIRNKFSKYIRRFIEVASAYEYEMFRLRGLGLNVHQIRKKASSLPKLTIPIVDDFSPEHSRKISAGSRQAIQQKLFGPRALFADVNVKKREMAMYAKRIESWKGTVSYLQYVSEWNQHIQKRAAVFSKLGLISTGPHFGSDSPEQMTQNALPAHAVLDDFDTTVIVARLGVNRTMDVYQLQKLYDSLYRALQSDEEIMHMLAQVPMIEGGLTQVCSGLYHPSNSIRQAVCQVLDRLRAHRIGLTFVQKLNQFLGIAYMRGQDNDMIQPVQIMGLRVKANDENVRHFIESVDSVDSRPSYMSYSEMSLAKSEDYLASGSFLSVNQLDVPQLGSVFESQVNKVTSGANQDEKVEDEPPKPSIDMSGSSSTVNETFPGVEGFMIRPRPPSDSGPGTPRHHRLSLSRRSSEYSIEAQATIAGMTQPSYDEQVGRLTPRPPSMSRPRSASLVSTGSSDSQATLGVSHLSPQPPSNKPASIRARSRSNSRPYTAPSVVLLSSGTSHVPINEATPLDAAKEVLPQYESPPFTSDDAQSRPATPPESRRLNRLSTDLVSQQSLENLRKQAAQLSVANGNATNYTIAGGGHWASTDSPVGTGSPAIVSHGSLPRARRLLEKGSTRRQGSDASLNSNHSQGDSVSDVRDRNAQTASRFAAMFTNDDAPE